MFALGPVSRRTLATAALLSLIAAVETTPLEVRSEGGEIVFPAPRVSPRPASTAFLAVVPRRDPFAGTPVSPRFASGTSSSPRSAPFGLGGAVSLSAIPALPRIPVAPPILTAPRVTAIVTGARPFALVEDGGLIRILTVGDRLWADRIVAIDIDGVHLAHGTTLPVAPTTAPPTGIR